MSSRTMVYHAWAQALCDGVSKDSNVMGVGKDSDVMGVGKDLGHGT